MPAGVRGTGESTTNPTPTGRTSRPNLELATYPWKPARTEAVSTPKLQSPPPPTCLYFQARARSHPNWSKT